MPESLGFLVVIIVLVAYIAARRRGFSPGQRIVLAVVAAALLVWNLARQGGGNAGTVALAVAGIALVLGGALYLRKNGQ